MIFDRSIKLKNKTFKVHTELFDSSFEMARSCKGRPLTDDRFKDMSCQGAIKEAFAGVTTYEQAIHYLRYGYTPTIENLKETLDGCPTGERSVPMDNVVGYAPIVPLVLQGIPNNMQDIKKTIVKSKVISIYYDVTCKEKTGAQDIVRAGEALLSTLITMESRGYRLNLYGIQCYSDEDGCDMVAVNVKPSNRFVNPVRISFPLTHPAFFRVIGWDWYSKCPRATYRVGYGKPLPSVLGRDECSHVIKKTFGKQAIYVSAQKIIDSGFDQKEIEKQILEVIK